MGRNNSLSGVNQTHVSPCRVTSIRSGREHLKNGHADLSSEYEEKSLRPELGP
jgi:hypothetical protein